ncbi:MAG: hypothetical protein NVS9B6_16700 [Candidatus Limnocylindrales bacterium]
MTVLLLHGGFVDDFLLDIVLPVVMFFGLYIWADRKSKREKAAKLAAMKPAEPVGPDDAAAPLDRGPEQR